MISSIWPPSSSPVPRMMARLMFSAGMLAAFAARTAERRRGFPSGSPPLRAAIIISLMMRVNTFPRLASRAAFLCLMVAHLECPDIWNLCSREGAHVERECLTLRIPEWPRSIAWRAGRRRGFRTRREGPCGRGGGRTKNRETNRGPDVADRFQTDAAVVVFDDASAEGESETGLERKEHVVPSWLLDAASVVRYQKQPAITDLRGRDADLEPLFATEFDGIREQLGEELNKLVVMTLDNRKAVKHDFPVTGVEQWSAVVNRTFDHGATVDPLRLRARARKLQVSQNGVACLAD